MAKKKKVSLQIGDSAPDFTLKNQDNEDVSLSDFLGKNVVVYFYPKAMTPGCTVQACALRDSQNQLKKKGIIILGISTDSISRLKKFEEKEELNFTLLSDEDHQVCESYGVWSLKKFMGKEYMGILRQSFFLDKKGKILHILEKVETKNHHQEVIDFYSNLK